MPAPQPRPAIGKARDSGGHPAVTPPPAPPAATAQAAGRRRALAQHSTRIPVDLADRLDAALVRLREEGRRVTVQDATIAALELWLTREGL